LNKSSHGAHHFSKFNVKYNLNKEELPGFTLHREEGNCSSNENVHTMKTPIKWDDMPDDLTICMWFLLKVEGIYICNMNIKAIYGC
jgi:hypothetical protein